LLSDRREMIVDVVVLLLLEFGCLDLVGQWQPQCW
jgi:hypothetical protein